MIPQTCYPCGGMLLTSIYLLHGCCSCIVVQDLKLSFGSLALCVSLPLDAQEQERDHHEHPVANVGNQCTHSRLITPAEHSVQYLPNAVLLLVAAMQLPQEVLIVTVLLQLMDGPSEQPSSDDEQQRGGEQQEVLEPHGAAPLVQQPPHENPTHSTHNSRNRQRGSGVIQPNPTQKDHRLAPLPQHNTQRQQHERVLAPPALQCRIVLPRHGLLRHLGQLLLPLPLPRIHPDHGKRHHRDQHHRNEPQYPLPQRLRARPRLLRHSIVQRKENRGRHHGQQHPSHHPPPHMLLHPPALPPIVHDPVQQRHHHGQDDRRLQRLPEQDEKRRHAEQAHHLDPN
ncbi:hypothetical protein KC19_8G119800 [Ceratodon purpureus]|uniref:Uncharacterized protein n=1 Tax=Ceratodon purpureus TaxID=3225 RepID=A0A8T0GXQ0_CERPU|nr:hypothetical protein KC19_8G119800 [Ceratodon purpureus]